MNSVLLVGSDLFSTSVTAQVRSLNALTVMTAQTIETAIEIMEVSIPDVVIAQADLLTDGSVNKSFGEDYSSPYYVLIDEPSQLPARQENPLSPQQTKPSNSLSRSIDDLSERYVEEKAIALESGADAYLWRLPIQPDGFETSVSDRTNLHKNGYASPHRSGYSDSDHLTSQSPNGQSPNGQSLNGQSSGGSISISPAPLITFRPSQQRLIQAHIHIGLNRAQRYRDLSRINDWLSAVALVDALTQLSNRRAFDMELPRQIKIARVKGKQLSLMVIDIDAFKSVNDRHGHLVGDDVLKQLAKRLLANMRFYDAPFRYGGEEFVVTLTNTGIEEGKMIAERLRRSIERAPFKLEMLADGLEALDITVSIGLTQLKETDDEKGASFLHRADQNLLKAKANGRNQVVCDRQAKDAQ